MMTQQIELEEPLVSSALDAAKQEGLSLQDWVRETLRARLAADQQAADYFRNRRRKATGDGFRHVLELIPDNPPDPGDEWDNLQSS